MIGKKYGKLTVLKLDEKRSGKRKYYICQCDCGNLKSVRDDCLKSGNTKSCGCLLKEINNSKTQYTKEKLYYVWAGMKSRCNNPNTHRYEDYGGRGIKVYDEWNGEHDYVNFRTWAINNGYSEGLTIDRIDVNGNYEPNNCRWVNQHVQSRNTRRNLNITYNGETHVLQDWSKILNINSNTLYHRIYTLGWDIKEAFDPFYTATTLSEATNLNVLHELKATLLGMGVFDMDEVNEFIDLYIRGEEADKWAPIIDVAAQRFNLEIEWAENGKADFKMKCKQFVKVYSKAAAIMSYEVKDWEKLFWFLRFLIPELYIEPNGGNEIKDLLDYVDLNTYGLRRTVLNETIKLDAGETVIDPNKPIMVNAGGEDNEPKDPLDIILKDFNERWFKGWDATPDDQKAKLISITKAVTEDEDYQTLVVGNPDKQAVDEAMATIIDRIIRKKRKGDMSLYKEYQQNDGFKYNLRNLINRMLGDLDYVK